MSSRRAVSLATTCLRLRQASHGQQSNQLLSSLPRIQSGLWASRVTSVLSTRQKHTIPRPPPSTPSPSPTTQPPSSSAEPPSPSSTDTTRSPPPQYELTFTCVPCGARSTHKVSKQGYHHGSVLIACPSCKNRHVISDHLKIFHDRRVTVEDLLREKGQLVKRGTLGEDGDLEFWEDGSTTPRDKGEEKGDELNGKGDGEEGWRDTAPGATFGKKVGGQSA